MFRLKSSHFLIYPVIFIVSLFLLAGLIPALRPGLLNALETPLHILNFFKREISGIIFYHRNMSERERLQKESDFLVNKLVAMDEVVMENKRLNSLLSLKQKSLYKVIAARVIARPADNWSSGLLINKGSNSGIKEGYAVINYLGLLGRIQETSSSVSKVMLVNDTNFSASSIVQRSRQEGLVSGTLGNSLIMRYLPKDADIEPGDLILTSGLTKAYPKGLVVGTVVDVGDEFQGLSRYAVLRPATDLSNVEEVLIIIP